MDIRFEIDVPASGRPKPASVNRLVFGLANWRGVRAQYDRHRTNADNEPTLPRPDCFVETNTLHILMSRLSTIISHPSPSPRPGSETHRHAGKLPFHPSRRL